MDRGFAREQSVQVVVRPEDIEVVSPMEGQLTGVVNDVIFKGVHFEMHVDCEGREWLIHSTRACTPVSYTHLTLCIPQQKNMRRTGILVWRTLRDFIPISMRFPAAEAPAPCSGPRYRGNHPPPPVSYTHLVLALEAGPVVIIGDGNVLCHLNGTSSHGRCRHAEIGRASCRERV